MLYKINDSANHHNYEKSSQYINLNCQSVYYNYELIGDFQKCLEGVYIFQYMHDIERICISKYNS